MGLDRSPIETAFVASRTCSRRLRQAETAHGFRWFPNRNSVHRVSYLQQAAAAGGSAHANNGAHAAERCP